MKIGILGAGRIGGALAGPLSALGHDVWIANSRGPASLGAVAASTGARPAGVEDVVRNAGVVVVAIPLGKVPALDPHLFSLRETDAPVIDTTNYDVARDGRIEELWDDDQDVTDSAWVGTQIGTPVVKVFNNIIAQRIIDLARPAGDPRRVALPVAGDDRAPKQRVMTLVDELGFDPVDAGPINESWRQHIGTPGFITDLQAGPLRAALQAATRDHNLAYRQSILPTDTL